MSTTLIPNQNSAFPADQALIAQINELMTSGFEIPADRLVPSANLKTDLGLDSLDAVDMLVFIEDKFGIKVDGEKLMSLQTLQDVYSLAAEAVGKTQEKTTDTVM
jgi:acyl carrier protein